MFTRSDIEVNDAEVGAAFKAGEAEFSAKAAAVFGLGNKSDGLGLPCKASGGGCLLYTKSDKV